MTRQTNKPSIQPPRPIRFQARDETMLRALYDYGGVLARRQIKALFWSATSLRVMEERLAFLHGHDYLAWPDRSQRHAHAIPEPICFLGARGGAVEGRSGGA
jgi:hypothetical protein